MKTSFFYSGVNKEHVFHIFETTRIPLRVNFLSFDVSLTSRFNLHGPLSSPVVTYCQLLSPVCPSLI